MALYMAKARPRKELLENLQKDLSSGKISKMSTLDIQTKAPKELIREYQTPEGGKVMRQNHNMQKSRISSSSASKPSDYVRYAPSTILKAGTPAPDFTLHTTPDQKVSLSEFRNRPTILAFYPADWSPVCGDEMTLFNEILPEFEKFNAAMVGISVDGVWCHLAFSKDRKLRFPLFSDFEPKGEVAMKYGVYRREDGVSERALFVIDKDGIIRWSYVSPIGVNPGAQGILNALESLNSQKEKVGVNKE